VAASAAAAASSDHPHLNGSVHPSSPHHLEHRALRDTSPIPPRPSSRVNSERTLSAANMARHFAMLHQQNEQELEREMGITEEEVRQEAEERAKEMKEGGDEERDEADEEEEEEGEERENESDQGA